jgi:hypothetical protein
MAHSLATASTPHAVTDLATPSLHHPHTLISFVAALLCLAIATLPGMFLNLTRSQERRLYWGSVVGAAVFAAISVLPDWKLSIGVAAFGITLMTASAYMSSPHIKIRGKVYAYHLSDSQPDPSPDTTSTPQHGQPNDIVADPAPDSYSGIATAQKSWWNMVAVMVLLVLFMLVPSDHKPLWMRPTAAAILVLFAAAFGYIDASWGYTIARAQRLQFAIIAIVTAGIHTIIYLLAFRAGRRWPYRPTRSMEYDAHPRFQRPDGKHQRPDGKHVRESPPES